MAARSIGLALVVALVAAGAGCRVDPVAGLWPPAPGEERVVVGVVREGRHTRIVEPVSESPDARTRVWDYAARSWMLDGETGPLGVLRLALRPEAGVGLEVFGGPFSERFPRDLYPDQWRVALGRRGYEAMLAHLEAQAGEPIEGHPGWRRARRDYGVFHHCHHFTAAALRAAGLPLHPRRHCTARAIGRRLESIERAEPPSAPGDGSDP